ARLMSDGAIAGLLNRAGQRTGRGNTWTEARVRSFRTSHGIAVYRDGERAERGELTLEEAAARLSVSKMTVLRMIKAGTLTARHACKGAPWVIAERAIETLPLGATASRWPVTENTCQISFDFQ
ncbi:MAG: helix-turn-helix domain-containing protein, partial [Alphaproteobacteria bacterium]